MTKYLVTLIVIVSFLAGPASADTGLAKLVPARAIAYLETDDLASLLDGIASQPATAAFLESAAYQQFASSKLFLKLEDRLRALEENTGFGLNFERLRGLAGGESALALYDIGELSMTLITRIGEEKVQASALWPLRDSFDTRKTGENDDEFYYVKEDPYGRASLAFAFVDDLLIISTDVLRFETTLALINGQGSSLAQASLFGMARILWPKNASLRLYLDQKAINQTPHFRSYWLFGNQQEFKDIGFTLASLQFEEDKITEQRIFGYTQPRQWSRPDWGTAIEGLTPVLASYSSMSADETGSWIESVFPALGGESRTALTETLAKAEPRAQAVFIEKTSGGASSLAAAYAIRLDKPDLFDAVSFEAALATEFSKGLLPEIAEPLAFAQQGDYRVFAAPLMESATPAYALKDGVLLIRPVNYNADSYISRAGTIPSELTAFGSVDLSLMRELAAADTKALSSLSSWTYSQAKDIISGNLASLLNSLKEILWIESRLEGMDNLLRQEIIYHLQ